MVEIALSLTIKNEERRLFITIKICIARPRTDIYKRFKNNNHEKIIICFCNIDDGFVCYRL